MKPTTTGRSFQLSSFPSRGIDMLSATVERGGFDPHFHDHYLIGLTVAGIEHFRQDGREGRSLPGQVRVVPPGVVHTGAPGSAEPWRYIAFYIAPALIPAAPDGGTPVFGEPVINDPDLFASGTALAESLSNGDEAARDSAQHALLERLAMHGSAGPEEATREPRKVALARDFIRQHMVTNVRLDEVAEAVGLSKFHLLRTFKAATGLTPWRYQVQLRLATARDLLRAGTPASQVAVVCGFFDQSHFTRLFRASYGITPAAFAAAHRAETGRIAC
jgi:AraC family chemosensory pili system transcriptional regulator ChpD